MAAYTREGRTVEEVAPKKRGEARVDDGLFIVLRGRMARVIRVARLSSGGLSVTVANGPMPDSREWARVGSDEPLWIQG